MSCSIICNHDEAIEANSREPLPWSLLALAKYHSDDGGALTQLGVSLAFGLIFYDDLRFGDVSGAHSSTVIPGFNRRRS